MICIAAVSCSTDAYRLPAMGFGIWLAGKRMGGGGGDGVGVG